MDLVRSRLLFGSCRPRLGRPRNAAKFAVLNRLNEEALFGTLRGKSDTRSRTLKDIPVQSYTGAC